MRDSIYTRLARASKQLDSLYRELAFSRVYVEGRWKNGADSAACLSGWSDVSRGQATGALSALVEVVETYGIRSYLDLPVGDGCFSSHALARLRQKQARAHRSRHARLTPVIPRPPRAAPRRTAPHRTVSS